jgi:hypothetical protein
MGGQATTLDSNGNGFWNDTPYENGSVFTDGAFWFSGGIFYIAGQATTLDYNGCGGWNGDLYIFGGINNTFSGQLSLDGYYGSDRSWYINGQWTDLEKDLGHGYYDGHLYVSGTIDDSYTGALEFNYTNNYIISGVLTTLDQDGNGTWNGQTYVDGVVQGGGGGGNNLPPNYKGVWDNFTDYSQDDVVSLNDQYWILSGFAGWTVGGAPGLGYGWTRYGTSLVRVLGRGRFLGRVKFAS